MSARLYGASFVDAMKREPRPHPCAPIPAPTLRVIEAAGLLALADPAGDRSRVELRDMALVSLALSDQGVGPEAADLAARALRELDDGAATAATMTEMVGTLLGQLSAANVRQFQKAQDAAIAAQATLTPTTPK